MSIVVRSQKSLLVPVCASDVSLVRATAAAPCGPPNDVLIQVQSKPSQLAACTVCCLTGITPYGASLGNRASSSSRDAWRVSLASLVITALVLLFRMRPLYQSHCGPHFSLPNTVVCCFPLLLVVSSSPVFFGHELGPQIRSTPRLHRYGCCIPLSFTTVRLLLCHVFLAGVLFYVDVSSRDCSLKTCFGWSRGKVSVLGAFDGEQGIARRKNIKNDRVYAVGVSDPDKLSREIIRPRIVLVVVSFEWAVPCVCLYTDTL